MKSTSNKDLPCALFGHNYSVTKENLNRTSELTCSHCNIVVTTDTKGNFETITISDSRIKDTLQELYRLSQRFIELKISS
ncbi:hypothetical protein [Winogradskyella sp. R77965]|uniref:hypothetical protein n=1 Tax=Winogradskyella sp. R77965 TaxID=3093872 RepID=UPI0037DD1714